MIHPRVSIKLGNGKRVCIVSFRKERGIFKVRFFIEEQAGDQYRIVGYPKAIATPAEYLSLDLDNWLRHHDFPYIREKRRRDLYVKQIVEGIRQIERQYPQVGEVIRKIRTTGDALRVIRDAGKPPGNRSGEVVTFAHALLNQIAQDLGFEDFPQDVDLDQRLGEKARTLCLRLETLLGLAEYDSALYAG